MTEVKKGPAWVVTRLAPRSVKPGRRYRTLRESGAPTSIVWQVVEVYAFGPDGPEHARLRRLDDPTETRTLATSVVLDRVRFLPEDPED
jgi:hypothetical protein